MNNNQLIKHLVGMEDLTAREIKCLLALTLEPMARLEVSKKTKLHPTNVSKVLARLEKRKLITRNDEINTFNDKPDEWRKKPLPKSWKYHKYKERKEEKVTRKEVVQDKRAYDVARHLHDAIVTWNDSYTPVGDWLEGWAKEIDKMIRIDKRDPDLIMAVITNMAKDKGNPKFAWRVVIQSGKKLRAQFNKLAPRYAPRKPKKDHRVYDNTPEVDALLNAPLDEDEKELYIENQEMANEA